MAIKDASDLDRPMKRAKKRTMTDRESGYYDKPKKKKTQVAQASGTALQAAEAARQLERRGNVINQAVDDATSSTPSKPKRKTRSKGATSYEEAKSTEHKGSEGETAYGQQMQDSPYGQD